MRKKTSNPISLFSFQDIITSLTGIMIVVVLVILLQLVETVSQAAAQTEQHPEFKIMRDKLAELRDLKSRLEQQLAVRKKEEPSPLARMPEAELRFMLRKRENQILQEQMKLTERKKDISRMEEIISRIEERISQLKKQIEEQQAKIDRVKNLSMKLALLKKKKNEIKDEIEKKRKLIFIEFTGDSSRIPVLITVYPWGFRAKVHPDGQVQTFGIPGRNTSPLSNVNKLKQWLERVPGRSYPVLLFRRDSLRFHNDIVFNYFKSQDIGRDLLGDGEECF